MPSFNAYRESLSGKTVGEMLKKQSDDIMNNTWWNDINSTVGYIYDYYHDSEPLKLTGLNSNNDSLKIPIDIKVLKSASQTYEKDQVTAHLQLRPNQQCNVYYYKEFFEDRYSSIFPIGLYIDIKDANGKYNRWLIVDKANKLNERQFPTYEILPCDKIFQYIAHGAKHQIAGVLRSQNSYNSGVWSAYITTSPEDQQKFVIPINRDTEQIYYDLRMIIDARVLSEPRAWKVTKINRISPCGIVRVTLAQDTFNQQRDYIELDEVGNVVGMWADYYDIFSKPKEEDSSISSTEYTAKITYSGTIPKIKVGGSYKKFSVKFYNQGLEVDPLSGEWHFTIDGADASSVLEIIPFEGNPAQIKLKAPTDAHYIGKIVTISYVTDKITASLEVEIMAL